MKNPKRNKFKNLYVKIHDHPLIFISIVIILVIAFVFDQSHIVKCILLPFFIGETVIKILFKGKTRSEITKLAKNANAFIEKHIDLAFHFFIYLLLLSIVFCIYQLTNPIITICISVCIGVGDGFFSKNKAFEWIKAVNTFVFSRTSSRSKASFIIKGTLIIAWIFMPLGIKGLREYIEVYSTYEICWYISFGFVVIAPYIVSYIIGEKKENYDITMISPKGFQVAYFMTTLVVIVFILVDLVNGLNGSLYSWGNMYDEPDSFPIYSVYLNFIRITLFLPSFLNIFIILFIFWNQLKTAFEACSTDDELINRKVYVVIFKRLNKLLFWGYVLFIVCVLTAYNNNPDPNAKRESYLRLIWKLLATKGNIEKIEASFALHIIFLIIPIVIACVYYYVSSSYLKRIVVDSIIRLQKDSTFDKDKLEKIEYVYFNDKSYYHISRTFFTYISVVIVPTLITFAIEQLLNGF